MKKSKSGGHKKKSSLSLEDQVMQRFARMLEENGYTKEWLPMVEKAWMMFCVLERPQIRSVEGYAAALDYAFVSFFLEEQGRSQSQIAKEYNTSVATLHRISKRMMECWQGISERILAETGKPMGGWSDDEDEQDEVSDEEAKQVVQELQIPSQMMKDLQALPQSQEHWVGGRRGLSMYIREPHPRRPDVVLWVDISGRPVVGQKIVEPDETESSVALGCLEVMFSPGMGVPRRPKQISVNHESWLDILRPILKPLQIEVKLGGNPVVDAIVTLMESHFRHSPDDRPLPTYSEDGKIPEKDLVRFFDVSAKLYELKPWQIVEESQVLQISLQRWGYENATVSVIGGGNESYGFLVLHSGFEFFVLETLLNVDEEVLAKENKLPPIHTLTLNFERGGDLEPSLRQEVFKHGWNIADVNAYPVIFAFEDLRYKRPLFVDDYRVVTVIAHALTAFLQQHADIFAKKSPRTQKMQVPLPFDMEGPPVEITYPSPEYTAALRHLKFL